MFGRSCVSFPPNSPIKCKVTAIDVTRSDPAGSDLTRDLSHSDQPDSDQWNFAGRVVERLGPGSCLIDAATQRRINPEDLPGLIAAHGVALLSAGLRKGDRVLIACSLSPSTALVYLGAMYVGLVAVPVEDREIGRAHV